MRSHIRITGTALGRWLLAQCLDSAFVGVLWLVGLLVIGVHWALFWALVGAALHFIPHIGGPLALLGPVCATVVEGHGWRGVVYVLILYVVIMLVDGFLVQPILLRRTSRVPVWASILVPLVLGYFLSFWGVLLSAPLLAIFFAFREHRREQRQLGPPVEIIPPEFDSHRAHREAPPTVIEGYPLELPRFKIFPRKC